MRLRSGESWLHIARRSSASALRRGWVMAQSRREKRRISGAVWTVTVIGLFFCCCSKRTVPESSRIGVVHSLIGTLALSEKPVAETLLLAGDELITLCGTLGS